MVILATGASYRRLGVPSLEALNGAGVFYGGPASEAHALSGKDAFIAGGGNSAGQAALHLARYASRVTLLVRSGSLESGMSHYLVREVGATSNVDVRTGTVVVGGGGEGRLQELVLRETASGAEENVAADALFVLIGARPRTGWLPRGIARDRHGFLFTGENLPDDHGWPLERRPFALETSMPGVFAAGDVRHASVKRVASAVARARSPSSSSTTSSRTSSCTPCSRPATSASRGKRPARASSGPTGTTSLSAPDNGPVP